MRTHSATRVLLLLLTALPHVRAITVAGTDPNSANIAYGQAFGGVDLSGVVSITSSIGGCSGSLLFGGLAILTAGHCVTSAFGNPVADNITVYFQSPSGLMPAAVSNVQVDPNYNGDSTKGYDLAVLTLTQPAPSFSIGYSLYNTALTSPASVILTGYGYGGTGLTGADGSYGTLRAGTNVLEGDGQSIFGWSSSLLVGQFYDINTPSTNALGLADPYYATDEVDIAHGDSGGPVFYNGQIIGVNDLIICAGTDGCDMPPSVSPNNNSYFGQLFAAVSVNDNSAFINAAQAPEPGTLALLLIGSVALLRRYRSRA